VGTVTDLVRSKSELVAENAFLLQQLTILRRQVKRPACTKADRFLLVLLARMVRTWKQALFIVQEDDASTVASPRIQALSEIDGVVEIEKDQATVVQCVRVASREEHCDTYPLPPGNSVLDWVCEERSYSVPAGQKLLIKHAQAVSAGTPLTSGTLDLRDLLRSLWEPAQMVVGSRDAVCTSTDGEHLPATGSAWGVGNRLGKA
jgi:hypothetical protein